MASPRGGYSPLSKWHDIQMTEILGLVLCWRKVRFAHLPSPKYYILFFWFWYFEAVRFASRIFLHQSTTSYFLTFGTLKQSDSLRESSCIKVLHPIFKKIGTLKQSDLLRKSSCIKVLHISLQLWYFGAGRFASRIFLHQSTASYSIVLSQVHLFLIYNKAESR